MPHIELKQWCLGLPTLVAMAYFAVSPPNVDAIVTDSTGYLEFQPFRSSGYPLFLDLVEALFGSATASIHVQLILFAGISVLLALEVYRFTGSFIAAFASNAAMWALPPLNDFHFQVVTESLFLSLILLLITALLRSIRTRSLASLVLMSLFVGLAATIRPVGFALIGVLIIFWLVEHRKYAAKRLVVVAALFLPFTLVTIAESIAHHQVHPAERQSLLGLHLFAKAGMVDVPDGLNAQQRKGLSVTEVALLESLGSDLQPVRDTADASDSFAVRKHVTVAYEIFLQYRYRPDLREALHAEQPDAGPWVARPLQEIALRRLVNAPYDYMKLSSLHYLGLWTVYAVRTEQGHAEFRRFMQENAPTPLSAQLDLERYVKNRVAYAGYAQLIVRLIGAVTLLSILYAAFLWLARRPIDDRLLVSVMGGLVVHGNFVLTALTGVAITRYTIAMWPAMALSLIFLGLYLFGIAVERFADNRRKPRTP